MAFDRLRRCLASSLFNVFNRYSAFLGPLQKKGTALSKKDSRLVLPRKSLKNDGFSL